MAIVGRMDVTLKFSELPTEVAVDKNGWRRFELNCGGKLVKVGMRPKNWAKVEQAARDWPLWTATLAGTFQVDDKGAMTMPEANVQVFERKPKPIADIRGIDNEKDIVELNSDILGYS